MPVHPGAFSKPSARAGSRPRGLPSAGAAASVRGPEVDEMAIAVELNFPDATLDQYDQVIARMGFHPGGPGGPGGLFHWVMKTDGGIRVVDVWQSAEQFQRFAGDQIGP